MPKENQDFYSFKYFEYREYWKYWLLKKIVLAKNKKDCFYESPFIIQYILKNKIIAIVLANTHTIKYDFIDKNL